VTSRGLLLLEAGNHPRRSVLEFAPGAAPVIGPPVVEQIDKLYTFKSEGGEPLFHRDISTGLSEHQFRRSDVGLACVLSLDLAELVLVADQ